MEDSCNAAGNMQNGLGRAARGIFFLAFLFFLNFLSRVLFSPLLPLIKEEFQLNNSQSGSLFFFITMGYMISVGMSGFVSARINHANTIFLSSCGAGGVLLLVPLSTSFASLCLSLFVLGLVAGLYLPSGLRTIFASVPTSFLARGIAIHELAPNLGFIMAPLVWQAASLYLSWRGCLFMVGALLGLTGIVYRFSGYPLKSRGVRPSRRLLRLLLGNYRFWLLVFLFSFAICSTLGMFAMLPLFLVSNHGMSTQTANYIVAATRGLSLFTPFLGGWLGDRFGNSVVMTTVLLSVGVLTVCIGLSSGKTLIVLITLQAMVAVCFFPSGLAVLSSFTVEGQSSAALPFCIPLAFMAGGGLIPLLIGIIGDVTSIGTGIAVAGGGIFVAGCAALALLRAVVVESGTQS